MIKRLGLSLVELLVLLLILVLLLGSIPVYPYSREWGYGPSGLFLLVLVVVLVVALARRGGGGPDL